MVYIIQKTMFSQQQLFAFKLVCALIHRQKESLWPNRTNIFYHQCNEVISALACRNGVSEGISNFL